ncbi:MAG: amidinotransferase [Flavobacteriales bacterium]|nr:amidinotransferase [Flavobacteriales bacterium]MBL6873624.1 amidinotransferase [Flavobacteriales bacterium]
MSQITKHIMMIEPVGFRFNEETAENNYYQKVIDGLTPQGTQEKALSEFTDFVDKLRSHGVNVIVIKDTESPDTPDSIFPNNWVSFHNDGKIGLYPMCAKNRRVERREDIFDILVDDYGFHIDEIKDFTEFEEHDKFLEGTGSMILDRENKICYAAISIRTDEQAVLQFCDEFDYTPVCFNAYQNVGEERLPIYHTNVMMCVANDFVVICLDTIDQIEERTHVIESLERTNKEIIEISEEQKEHFAGNMLQVMGDKPYLVMSKSAYKSLDKNQIEKIEKHCSIIHSSLDTIEACGGGSARCMMAEIFLPQTK